MGRQCFTGTEGIRGRISLVRARPDWWGPGLLRLEWSDRFLLIRAGYCAHACAAAPVQQVMATNDRT